MSLLNKAARLYLLWMNLGSQKWWSEYIKFCKNFHLDADLIQVAVDDLLADLTSHCQCPECHQFMRWCTGYPDSLEEPGQPDVWYCSACGLDYTPKELEAVRKEAPSGNSN